MSESYALSLTNRAKRNLGSLDRPVAKRIMGALLDLAENVHSTGHFALKGRWKGLYRLRIGDYRAIYDLKHEKKRLVVVGIGHRSTVYD